MSTVLPYVLYHYTSLETMLSIVQNKTIRLSDITKSNDSKEISLLKDDIPCIFKAAYEAEKSLYFKNNINPSAWNYWTETTTNKWFNEDYNGYSYCQTAN